jgi:small nuclear ribonucleoprotein (snRNP)-like protein
MKEKMTEWISANWSALDSNTAKSLVNRVVAVTEKENATIKGALTGLAQSLNALANNEKTPEQSVIEVWFMAEFITHILIPVADSIDSHVKAKTTKPKPVWADSQEEAKAIAQAIKPEKPTRAPRGAQAPAIEPESDLVKALATLLAGLQK